MPELDLLRPRNDLLVDWWSLTHIAWGVGLTAAFGPFAALLTLTLWEPLEVLVLSPFLARRGINFGHESVQNSLVDLLFNVVGVLAATFILLPLVPGIPVWPLRVAGS
jgi:hypothetical protein